MPKNNIEQIEENILVQEQIIIDAKRRKKELKRRKNELSDIPFYIENDNFENQENNVLSNEENDQNEYIFEDSNDQKNEFSEEQEPIFEDLEEDLNEEEDIFEDSMNDLNEDIDDAIEDSFNNLNEEQENLLEDSINNQKENEDINSYASNFENNLEVDENEELNFIYIYEGNNSELVKENFDFNEENSNLIESDNFLIDENSVEESGIEISNYSYAREIKLAENEEELNIPDPADDIDPYAQNEIALKAINIKKNYGKKQVLKGINLEIKKGERVTLFGPNGAGKSTLTEIISQIKEQSSGEIEYSFGKTRKEIARKIGIQFQATSYPYYFSVMDIIKFFVDLGKMNLTKDEINAFIKEFQLEGLEKHRADALSGGQKQRLNIMLAVMNQPELLLLDEVSTGLDIEARTKIKSFIKDYILKNNTTLILVSHNPDEIEYLTERVVVIYDGIVWQDVKVKEIIKKYGTFEKYIDNLFLNEFKEEDNKKTQERKNNSKKNKKLLKKQKKLQKQNKKEDLDLEKGD